MNRKVIDRRKINKYIAVLIGVVINVGLSLIAHFAIGIPLYLDTMGTIVVSAVSGLYPGVLTALLTNLICTSFDPASLYFAIINCLIAMLTTYITRNDKIKRVGKIALLLFGTAFLSGIMGAIEQWALFGKPQIAEVEKTVNTISEVSGVGGLPCFLMVNFGLNLVDKAITVALALLLIRFTPQKVKDDLYQSEWRQKPLTKEQLKEMGLKNIGGLRTLRGRITALLAVTAVVLTVVITLISLRLYYDRTKEEHVVSVQNAAKFGAYLIDGDMVDTYLAEGPTNSQYLKTFETLKKAKDAFPGLEYLYVYQIREDGCHIVFDVDPEMDMWTEVNSIIPFDESFADYLPLLLNGEKVPPIESNDTYGWLLTAYEPVYNSAGKCAAYVGADISMIYLSDFITSFLKRARLIFSAFLLVILVYGIWNTGATMVYPINSMAAATKAFGGDDKANLEEHVKALRSLEIRTDDEIQNLYGAICRMAVDTTDQIKYIEQYTEAVTQMQRGLIITMADLVENRDSDTGAHIQKTAAYVRIILEGLKKKGYYYEKLTDKYISDVEMSAPLHDVGKIHISDTVLNKKGKLTEEEYEIMKTHTTAGRKIMERAISTVQGESYLKEARNMAAYHHEKWDGSGYPEGLHGEVIPLSARVMAVADVFDALVSRRVYKPPMTLERALEILKNDSGTHFDPKCVEAFIDSLDDVKAVMRKYQND